MFKHVLGGLLLLVMTMWGQAASAAALKELTVVADDNYPPFVFRDSRGQLAGLTVDLWHLWEQKTGTPVKLVATDWSKAQALYGQGQGDVIDTIFRTSEREKIYIYSKPYADIPVQVYAHQDIGGLTSIDLLRGFLVGVKAGDACADILKHEGVVVDDHFDSYEAMIREAANNRLRVFCMDEPPGNYLLYKAGIDRLFRKAFPLYMGQFHRAYRRANPALVNEVEAGFQAISAQEMQELRDKWMGSGIGLVPWARHLTYAVLGLLVVASAMVLWSVMLRRVVRQRTSALHDERRLLKTLINTLPDMVWLKDMQGVYRVVNARVEKFFGAPEADIVGKKDHDLVSPAVADVFRASDERALAAQDVYTHLGQVTYASDGHCEWVETTKATMRDAKGRVVGVLGIARDMTAHRDNEMTLQRLNRLYQVLIHVNEAIAQSGDLKALFQQVCDVLVQYGGVNMAWIGEPQVELGVVQPQCWAGQIGQYLNGLTIDLRVPPEQMGPTARAYETKQPDYCEDLETDVRMAPWRDRALQAGFRSSASLPIQSQGQVRAIVNLYTEQPGFFDLHVRDLVDRMAATLSMALQARETAAAQAQAQTRLAQSEARFSQMFLTSPIGMALSRLQDQVIVDVNEALQSLVGLPRDAIVGKTLNELNIWEHATRSERDQALQHLRWGEDILQHELVMHTASNDRRDVAWSATRVELADESLMLESFIDISHQKQFTKNLEYQNERLESAVNLRTAELHSLFLALPDQYYRLFRDGTIIDHRAGSQESVILHRLKKGMRLQQGLPVDAADRLTQALSQLAETGRTLIEYTLPASQNQAEVSYEMRLLPLGDKEAIAVIRDVTEQRALDRQREAAREEAERLARVKSEFLANMSHEIRTPLNGVLGLAQLGYQESAGQSAQKTFETILDSGRLLLGVLNDILDISKIEAGQLTMECTPVAIRDLLAGVSAMVASRAREKGLQLDVLCDEDVPSHMMGDTLRLEQVLLNLLSNAVKFTDAGRVQLRVSLEGQGVVFAVSDTGIGMSEQAQAKLFEPFQQADSSTTRRFGGTGLGLSISKKLVQMMGGAIHVTSVVGRGSRFEVRLPLADQAMAGAAPVDGARPGASLVAPPAGQAAAQGGAQAVAQGIPIASSYQPALPGVRVLAAEDSDVNQIVLRELLGMEQAEYTLARDGLEAVNCVRQHGVGYFDVVLMDVQMPIMDGYEAAKQVLQIDPGVPIVGLTAHAFGDALKACQAAGMVAHVSKPYDLRQLTQTILQYKRTRS